MTKVFTAIITVLAVVGAITGCQSTGNDNKADATTQIPTVQKQEQQEKPSIVPTTKYEPYSEIEFETPTPPAWITSGSSRRSRPSNKASEYHGMLFHLDVLPEAHEPTEQYDRREWGYGQDHDQNCRYTRDEILISESSIETTFQSERKCKVATGMWVDPWTGESHADPNDLHIDHHVPIFNAHKSGGYAWSQELKQAFSNDQDLPEALNAISAKTNLEKGADGPEKWKPENTAAHCSYAQGWISVKHKWHLAVSTAEKESLIAMLATC